MSSDADVSPKPIRRFCILGERCSGTHFLEHAIRTNFAGLVYDRQTKHFFGHHDDLEYAAADETLYIALVRHPVDWVDSFYRSPWHVPKQLLTSWSTFLTGEWWSQIDFDAARNGQELLEDRDPATGQRYADLFALRAAKARYLLDTLPCKAPQTVLIRYEDLRDNYAATLASLADRFGLRLHPEVIAKGESTKDEVERSLKSKEEGKADILWKPVVLYKGNLPERFRKKEVAIRVEQRAEIWNRLDKEVEARLGYFPE
jgi:hypothetical protein